jgi:hypothetical protein
MSHGYTLGSQGATRIHGGTPCSQLDDHDTGPAKVYILGIILDQLLMAVMFPYYWGGQGVHLMGACTGVATSSDEP